MMNASLSLHNQQLQQQFAQTIAVEANRVIASLSFSQPADRDAVESVIESLRAVAESSAPALAKTLQIRLVAIRNNIQVNQIQLEA